MANNEIKDHYASPGLLQRIVQGLEAIGKSPASVELDDLAAVDEFHLRGPAATRSSSRFSRWARIPTYSMWGPVWEGRRAALHRRQDAGSRVST